MSLLDRFLSASSARDAAADKLEIQRLAQALREAEAGQRGREELLRAVVENTPIAMVLLGETGRIVFTNAAARAMFFEGRAIEGQNFLAMLAGVPEALRRALLAEDDHIFTFDDGGGFETYHLSRRQLSLAGEPHTLLAVRVMTREISRQENTVLKKTIRIMQHELANSLAPVSSLLRTGRTILARPELHGKLETVFGTVEERLAHLERFVGGLAKFGKLPQPRLREVAWDEFLEGLRALWPTITRGPAPAAPGWFDPGQIQQVLINLIKNASEAGGPADAVQVDVEAVPEGGFRISVLDRGPGMSDEVMQNALLPSFTTKPTGSGMGLPLCFEIVEAHQGRLRIARRAGGGTVVSVWLPPKEAPETALHRAKLTLRRS